MYKFLTIIIIFLTYNTYAEKTKEWNFKFSGFMNSKTINLPSGGKVNNFSQSGTWEDSLGNYGKGYCYGISESQEMKDSFFQFYCEVSDQDNDKFFTKGSRKSEDAEAGVGKQTIIDGTGKWKTVIGTICVYGVKYVDKVLFASQKCTYQSEQNN